MKEGLHQLKCGKIIIIHDENLTKIISQSHMAFHTMQEWENALFYLI